MNYTENYELRKPDGSDIYDIADFNFNADKIDGTMRTNRILLLAAIDALNGLEDQSPDVKTIFDFKPLDNAKWGDYGAIITPKSKKCHIFVLEPVMVSLTYNTGHVLGTLAQEFVDKYNIDTAYADAFGYAVFKSSNVEYTRPVRYDNGLIIDSLSSSQIGIDEILFMDFTIYW